MNDSHAKLKGLLWLLAGLALGVSFALGISFFAKLTPWSIEEKGARAFGDFSEKVCDRHPEAGDLLKKIVHRLVPVYPADKEFPLTVEVIRDPEVNAFAFLGGHVYLNSGLLKQAESADEIAGVLAHEIEHVKQRHIVQGVFVALITMQMLAIVMPDVSEQARDISHRLLQMKFTKGQEHDADEGGLKRLQDSNIDVKGYQHFFERMAKLDLGSSMLSDHPSGEDRIALVKMHANRDVQPILTKKEFLQLKRICEN
jgi:predicted Zn-dependent protease